MKLPVRPQALSGFIAGTAGGLLPVAFAPFDFWPMAILSPALLLWTLHRASGLRTALLYGWLFGAAYWLAGLHWVYFSLTDFGGAHWAGAAAITVLLTAGLGLLQGITAVLWRLGRTSPLADALLLFPACWGLIEWLKGWLLTGLPWLDLGVTSMEWWAGGLLPLLSSRGVGILMAAAAGGLFLVFSRPSRKAMVAGALAALILPAAGLVAGQIPWTKPTGQQLSVRLVQTNLNAYARWTPGGLERSLRNLVNLTYSGTGSEDLILWPEASLPTLDSSPGVATLLRGLNQQFTARNQTLALGIVHKSDSGSLHNAMLFTGVHKGLYLKSRLVPFGEFTPGLFQPIVRFFRFPSPNLEPAPDRGIQLTLGDVPLAIAICYEIAYPDLVLPQAGAAGLVLTTSNDSWFGRSIGPWQHLQIARIRAAESGRWLLRAANGGIGAIVNEKGLLADRLEPFEADATSRLVPVFSGYTPAALLPVWVWGLLCMVMIAALRIRARYWRRRRL